MFSILRCRANSNRITLINVVINSFCCIQIKRCVSVLTNSPFEVRSAAAAVRYSTKHFNDDDTDDSIKEMFE